MHWIAAALLSALFLGVYELCTKHAVRNNAVLPVLFYSTLTGAVVWFALLGVDLVAPGTLPQSLVTDRLTGFQHLQLALRSPIRAMSPVVVLIGAVIILGERLTLLELLGVATTIGSFIGLSIAGRGEGVHFHRNKWVWFLVVGTLLGAMSALYDRYLLGTARFSVPTVQAWFSIYLLVFFTPFMIGWQRRWWPRNEFHWRWSIPSIALALLVADYIYFSALTHPEALVSLVMSLRRGSTLVAFAGGLLFFGERSDWAKTLAVLGILVGIALTVLG